MHGLGVSETDKALLDDMEPVLVIKKVSGAGAVRLFTESGQLHIGTFIDDEDAIDEVGGASMWNQLYHSDLNILAEGLRPGEVVLGYQLWVNGDLVHHDEVRITVVQAELVAAKINQNIANGDLPDTVEETIGAFVPLNKDDDDYDGILDRSDSGAVVGETDLLPLTLQPASITGGQYKLSYPATLKVWKNADRTDLVLNNVAEFDADTVTTVYVEGVNAGAGVVELSWTKDGITIANTDRVKVTVFEWAGPLNVPGYSNYRYTASGALESSQWIDGDGGSIHTASNPNDVNILWNEGPVVGKARYKVDNEYIWDLEVNVVRIKLSNVAVTYADPVLNPPVQLGGAQSPWVVSASPAGQHMAKAEIKVDFVEGPTVNGVQRGRKFMEIGTVHQTRVDGERGLYNDTIPTKQIRYSLQDSNRHWDAESESTLPWQDTDADNYLSIQDDAENVSNYLFTAVDTPALLGTDPNQFVLSADQVDIFDLKLTHWFYVAVKTKVTAVNGSDDVVTQRATLEWSMDISGTIDSNGTYQFTGSGASGPAAYTDIANGDRVPDAERNLHDAAVEATWIIENQ